MNNTNRLAGMSGRQRGLVGQMWNQKQAVDPGMSNRRSSFVKIMEHVAGNEAGALLLIMIAW